MTSEFNTRAHQKGVAGLQPSPKIEIEKNIFVDTTLQTFNVIYPATEINHRQLYCKF